MDDIRPPRPDWWPRENGAPLQLTEIVGQLHILTRELASPLTNTRSASRRLRRQQEENRGLYVRTLSFACRTWVSPSTPYEKALYDLCLAAIDEAQSTKGPPT